MKSHGFLLDSMLVPMIKSWNIHLLDWHWIDIVGQFTLSKYTKGNIWIHRGESNMIHWLVSTYPSEQWWSESQLGWWNSQVNGISSCSKPPIRFFHNYWILIPNIDTYILNSQFREKTNRISCHWRRVTYVRGMILGWTTLRQPRIDIGGGTFTRPGKRLQIANWKPWPSQNSEFSHWKWWFSIVFLYVYQRVHSLHWTKWPWNDVPKIWNYCGTTYRMNYPKMEEIHYQTRWMLENMDWLKYPQLEGISMKDRLTIGDFMIYIFFCTKDGNSSNKTCPCGSFIICWVVAW